MRETSINAGAATIVVIIWKLVAWLLSLASAYLPIRLTVDDCFMVIVAFVLAMSLFEGVKSANRTAPISK